MGGFELAKIKGSLNKYQLSKWKIREVDVGVEIV